MKFLSDYYKSNDDQQVIISAEQASSFAKKVAGDFNPIHDPGSRRFCVPGDLLFAIALDKYGLNSSMSFQFLNLVSAENVLDYPVVDASQSAVELEVQNEKGRPVLGVQYHGECTKNAEMVEQVLRQYVHFSGQNFPHILVPLMEQHNVMINPKRPLVIYESMSFEFSSLEFKELEIVLGETSLTVDGKRGDAQLNFTFIGDGQVIGSGSKTLVLSGLREYDRPALEQMCADYEASKA